VEVGFWQGWSIGVEYDHLFMGSHDISFTAPGGAFEGTDHISQSVDMGLVRLNYRWGGPAVARY
jgi:outer membrane immunogenic protein